MVYMVVETFRNAEPAPIYERLAERGRMMPDNLTYVNSWISEDFSTCWQVMETDDPASFDAWIAQWSDLMDFQVFPVMSSAEARAKAGGDGDPTRLGNA